MDRATNITTSETARLDLALLLLRCASAPPFLYHGSAILFGWFGGPGPAKFAASHHWPVFLAYLVGTAQVGGGLAMVSGMFFRSGCASVFVVMVGAIFLVHLRHGFNVVNGGAEYALAQMLIAVVLVVVGAGRYSLAFLAPSSIRKL